MTVKQWVETRGSSEVIGADDGRCVFLEKVPNSNDFYYMCISDKPRVPMIGGNGDIEQIEVIEGNCAEEGRQAIGRGFEQNF